MSTQTAISNTSIPSLPIGSYRDSSQKGLRLEVTSKSRIFKFYGYLHGKPVKRRIGTWPEMDAKVARKHVQAIWAEAPPAKAAPTVGSIAEMYSRKTAMEGNRTDHMADTYRLNWTCYDKRPIDQITVGELQGKHDEIYETRGPQAARRAIRALRTLFSYAIGKEYAIRNPAASVDTASVTKRTVRLDERECGIFFECIEDMARDPRDFFKVSIGTGLRKSNVLGMRKEWISFEQERVVVPADYSKNKREMCLPLTPNVLEVLRGRMPGSDPYVFPGRCGGHIVDASAWIKELRMRMRQRGVDKHFTIHDLRRTLATRLLRAGVSKPIIAAMLGHINLGSTDTYAHADLDMMRAAMLRAVG
jgi:integrase